MHNFLVMSIMVSAFVLSANAYSECCTKTGTKGSCQCCCDGTPSCGGDGESCACSCLSKTGDVTMNIKGMSGKQIMSNRSLAYEMQKILPPNTLDKLKTNSTPLSVDLIKKSKKETDYTFRRQLK